jgi:hypothetical protein
MLAVSCGWWMGHCASCYDDNAGISFSPNNEPPCASQLDEAELEANAWQTER